MENRRALTAFFLFIVAIGGLIFISYQIKSQIAYQEEKKTQNYYARYIFENIVATPRNSNLPTEKKELTDENVYAFINNPEEFIRLDGNNGFFLMAKAHEYTDTTFDWQTTLDLIYQKKFREAYKLSRTSTKSIFPLMGRYSLYSKHMQSMSDTYGIVIDENTPYEEIEAFINAHQAEIDEDMQSIKDEYYAIEH